MPRLWNETIAAHRRQVRDAILDTTAALVADRGLLGVTMSQIAADTGIGRATLYKYFAGVEGILLAWHERQIAGHLEQLVSIRDQAGSADARLAAVLAAYADVQRARRQHQEPHASELTAFLHRDENIASAAQRLHDLVRELLAEASASGDVRDDVTPEELASYCLHALNAAASLPSKAATHRLVQVVLAGLRPLT